MGAASMEEWKRVALIPVAILVAALVAVVWIAARFTFDAPARPGIESQVMQGRAQVGAIVGGLVGLVSAVLPARGRTIHIGALTIPPVCGALFGWLVTTALWSAWPEEVAGYMVAGSIAGITTVLLRIYWVYPAAKSAAA